MFCSWGALASGRAKIGYLAVTLPAVSRVTFTGKPSFTALPCQIPLSSFFSPETFEYPSASICDFA